MQNISKKDFVDIDTIEITDDINSMSIDFNNNNNWNNVVVWFNGKIISTSKTFNCANALIKKHFNHL